MLLVAQVDDVLHICEPILQLLRLADSNAPAASKIYWSAYKVQQHLEEDLACVDAATRKAVRSRCSSMCVTIAHLQF